MRSFNFAQRIMLQHAHPAKLAIDGSGIVLGIYFLWVHQLPYALLSLFGLSILGNIVVWKVDIVRLSETPLGRWMLAQAHPVNLAGRSLGALILACGVWFHSGVVMGLGVAGIMAARWVSTRQRAAS